MKVWMLILAAIVGAGILVAALITPKTVQLAVENGSIEVCFTGLECRQKVYGLLGNASSIKAVLYDLDDKTITAILKDKKAQLLVDSDSYFGLGESIDNEAGLMHNKIFLLYFDDGSNVLISGSANPTRNDMERNHNNILIIRSPTLFSNYEGEFDELATFKKTSTTHLINLSGIMVESYFCPEDHCEDQVISEIKSAQSSIRFMTFSFTSDEIGDAVMLSGLDVKGVFDSGQVSSQKDYTEYYRMLGNGLDVQLDNSTYKVHHKVFIIDNSTVVTGSYNPTQAGDTRNDENLLIIHDPAIARLFAEEFDRIYQ